GYQRAHVPAVDRQLLQPGVIEIAANRRVIDSSIDRERCENRRRRAPSSAARRNFCILSESMPMFYYNSHNTEAITCLDQSTPATWRECYIVTRRWWWLCWNRPRRRFSASIRQGGLCSPIGGQRRSSGIRARN